MRGKLARPVREGVVGKRTSNAGTSPDGLPRGLRNLPLHELDQNRIWCALVALAVELTAWAQLLALPADPARRWEPKRLRLRIFSLAGRLVRTGRRTVLHLAGQAPWAALLLKAITTLRALPEPG
jgi:Transposase DDE domain group 1